MRGNIESWIPVVIAVWLYCWSSFHDAWTARLTGWWPFHISIWLYRDLVVACLLWLAYGWPWKSFRNLGVWMTWACVFYWLHKLFYWLGECMIQMHW